MSIEYLLRVTPGEMESIEKSLLKSRDELKEDVYILKGWWGKQPHLPPLTPDDDDVLSSIIIRNKYRIEACKTKIEYYYSTPHIYPELFQDRQPLHPRMQKVARTAFIIPLPRLAPDFGRITIFSFPPNDSQFDEEGFYTRLLSLEDFRLRKDKSVIEHDIIDLQHFTLDRLLRTNPSMVAKLVTILQGYSFSMGHVHIVNMPGYAQRSINIIKSMMKEKLKARIFVHEKREDIFKYFPKDIIPRDYGGEERSLEELNDEWIKMLESHNSFFEDMGKRQSKEELRIGRLSREEFSGLQGTFRQLNVD